MIGIYKLILIGNLLVSAIAGYLLLGAISPTIAFFGAIIGFLFGLSFLGHLYTVVKNYEVNTENRELLKKLVKQKLTVKIDQELLQKVTQTSQTQSDSTKQDE